MPKQPLTAKQEIEIYNLVVDKILEDCKNPVYLESVVQGFVHTMSIERQLWEISSDTQCQKEDLGFDPKTGETYIEDVEVDLRDTCIDLDEENDNGG